MAIVGTTIKEVNPWVRRWLGVVVVFVSTIGIVLFVFSRRTEDYFAWTIKSPMTAAFLGAAYWASIPLSLLSIFRRYWADARLAFHGVGVFSALMLAATLIHLDKFRTHSFPGVMWIATYVAAPVIIFGLAIWMGRTPGHDPARRAPLASWERGLLLVLALLMLPLGAALFIAPTWADAAWPWTLTPLTARAIGTWLIGVGIVVLHIDYENDWVRIAPGTPAFALLGLLQLAAVARFSDEFNWDGAGAWLYAACLVAISIIGAYGVLRCWMLGIRFISGDLPRGALAAGPAG